MKLTTKTRNFEAKPKVRGSEQKTMPWLELTKIIWKLRERKQSSHLIKRWRSKIKNND